MNEPVAVGSAAKRLRRRATILDWFQVAFLVGSVFLWVGVPVYVHHNDVQHSRDSRAAQGRFNKQQQAQQRQNDEVNTRADKVVDDLHRLTQVAEALGRLATASTPAQRRQAQADLRRLQATTTTTTQPARAKPAATTTTTTAPRPPPTTSTTSCLVSGVTVPQTCH